MKGLKIRCTGGGTLGVKAVGADPIGMPMGDVYLAAQKGVFDANVAPLEVLEGWKHHEVFEYSTFVPQFYSEFFHINMNWAKWKALPKDLQDAFDAVAMDAVKDAGQIWQYQQQKGMDFAKAGPGGHRSYIFLRKKWLSCRSCASQ
jgi:TRAP-type C4-dicarboxylate transport system substrate-binding protein